MQRDTLTAPRGVASSDEEVCMWLERDIRIVLIFSIAVDSVSLGNGIVIVRSVVVITPCVERRTKISDERKVHVGCCITQPLVASDTVSQHHTAFVDYCDSEHRADSSPRGGDTVSYTDEDYQEVPAGTHR